ncbi:MAG: hypothetical protein R3C05_11640 [Pirellulaceae bacterium]
MNQFQNVCCVMAFGCLMLLGCGAKNPPTYPVSGTVKYPDGKLLTDGTVEFELISSDETISASGVIDADGHFELGTFDSNDGARPGKHRVAVFAPNVIGSGYERPGLIEKSTLDPRFSDFRSSGIEIEVREESNEVTIEVDYATEE